MSTSLLKPSARLQELLPNLLDSAQLSGDPYLQFRLNDDITAMLSMDDVSEALLVRSEHITALPNMAESVIGLMSSRDSVFGVVDLPHTLGYPASLGSTRQYQVIVVNIKPNQLIDNNSSAPRDAFSDVTLLGFAVPQIDGIKRLEADQLQPMDESELPELRQYTSGYVTEPDLTEPDLKAVLIDLQRIMRLPIFNQLAN